MSQLLDRGPHRVTVYLEETATDSYGTTIRRASPVGVVVSGCILTPTTVETEATRLTTTVSQREERTWRFRARTAPMGVWSRVVWHDGTTERRMHVDSGPVQYGYSSATRHVAATLREES